MLNYVDKHIISFVDEWGNTLVPQIPDATYHDATEVFGKTAKSKMILDSIEQGKHIYIVGFKGCRGMIRKWLHDDRGRMVRDKGRGVVSINESVITMSTVDINIPFVTSDEVLLEKDPRDRPYNLEPEIVEEAMRSFGFDPNEDIIFMFFVEPNKVEATINRFLDELKHIVTREYARAKGVLAVKDPKWTKYHASDEVTKYTNTFFFNGVNLTYTRREAEKNDQLGI